MLRAPFSERFTLFEKSCRGLPRSKAKGRSPARWEWLELRPYERSRCGEHRVGIESVDLPDEELLDETYVPVKKRIVAAMGPGEATIRELVQLTGAETGTIRNKLSELKSEGVVIDAGYRGREKLYSLLSSSPNPYRESTDDDNEPMTVAGLFANPPDWLPKQLKVYRENPARHLEPLCAAVAAVVLGDDARASEVQEEVERELERRET